MQLARTITSYFVCLCLNTNQEYQLLAVNRYSKSNSASLNLCRCLYHAYYYGIWSLCKLVVGIRPSRISPFEYKLNRFFIQMLTFKGKQKFTFKDKIKVQMTSCTLAKLCMMVALDIYFFWWGDEGEEFICHHVGIFFPEGGDREHFSNVMILK